MEWYYTWTEYKKTFSCGIRYIISIVDNVIFDSNTNSRINKLEILLPFVLSVTNNQNLVNDYHSTAEQILPALLLEYTQIAAQRFAWKV